jgi:hypothetical protein
LISLVERQAHGWRSPATSGAVQLRAAACDDALVGLPWRACLTVTCLLLLSIGACGGRSRDERSGGPPEIVAPDASISDAAPPANDVLDAGDPPAPALLRGCPGATPAGTGLERCADGVVHRTASVQCESKLPEEKPATLVDAAETYIARGGDPANVQCRLDTDCTERPHGYCKYNTARPPFSQCIYGCVSDEDCAAGEACACAVPIGSCEPAVCRTDDDCQPGSACTSWQYACSGYRFSCESDRDECRTSADCPEGLACELFGVGRGCRPPTECEITLD